MYTYKEVILKLVYFPLSYFSVNKTVNVSDG